MEAFLGSNPSDIIVDKNSTKITGGEETYYAKTSDELGMEANRGSLFPQANILGSKKTTFRGS